MLGVPGYRIFFFICFTESIKEANQSLGVKTLLDGETELSQDVDNLPNPLQVFLVATDFRTKLKTELPYDYSL